MITTLFQKLLLVQAGSSDSGTWNPQAQDQSAVPGGPAANAERLSIIWHLRRMLNTRKGSAASCEEYGLPEVNLQVVGHSQLQELAHAIRRTIVLYEPRLCDVMVSLLRPGSPALLTPATDALLAYFHISAVSVFSGNQLFLRATQLPEGDLCVRELVAAERNVDD